MRAAWVQVPALLTVALVCLTSAYWIVGLVAISALVLSDERGARPRSSMMAFVIVLTAFLLLARGHWILGLLTLVGLLFVNPELPTGDAHDHAHLDP